MKKLLFSIILACLLQGMSAWAAHTPQMNAEYVVEDFQFASWNKAQVPDDCFLEGAEKAIIKVKNAHYIVMYYSTDPWGNNPKELETIPYNNDGFTYTYTIEGAENIAAAMNGYYWVYTDDVAGKVLTITNCDANYVNPDAGGTGTGTGTGSGGVTPPGYEPDYTGQMDADDDGVLEPNDENPAFGIKVDYKKFPQLTDVPSMYITVYKTTATPDGEGGYTYEYDENQTEDISTTKNDWYYQCRIVIADKYGKMKQRDELVSLRGRGNSTWTWVQSGKRGLRLKFPSKTKLLAEQDAEHNEVNNFADAKNWTLLANAFDKTLIHNAFTYELGKGKLTNLPFCPAYRFVDLFVNGVYFGTYQVSDHVQVDKKRVNVDSKTGWFLELTASKGKQFLEDPYVTVNNGQLYANVKSPETATVGTDTYNAMEDYLTELYGKLSSTYDYGHDFSFKTGYRTMVDMPSLLDWFIGEEISANYDGTFGNIYTYREAENDKLHFGPMWDLDIAYGAHEGQAMSKIHIWDNSAHQWEGVSNMLRTLYSDPYFVRDLYERWQTIYNNGELQTFCNQKIDMLAGIVSQSQAKNYTEARPFNSTSVFGINQADNMGGSFESYDAAIAYFKEYLSARIEWLNSEYSAKYAAMNCATLDPCPEGHSNSYLLQANGTYLRGCDTCGHPDEKDTQTYYQFTIYPESKDAVTEIATAWQPSAEKPNAIAVVNASQDIVEQIAGWNIVTANKNAAGNRTCLDFRLTDGHPFYTKNKFVAAAATYTRTGIKNQWGTIVVPFAMENGADYDLYTLTSMSNDELTLTKVEGTLAAGTPALIRLRDGLAGNYTLIISPANNTVSNDEPVIGTEADGIALTGSYVSKDITAEDGYIISSNKFWNIQSIKGENGVKCAPFRAYLKSSAPALAKQLNISVVNDNEATAAEALTAITEGKAEYYDMNGNKFNNLQQGVNIVKMSNGKTQKVVIK